MPALMSRSAISARKSSSVNSPTHGIAPRSGESRRAAAWPAAPTPSPECKARARCRRRDASRCAWRSRRDPCPPAAPACRPVGAEESEPALVPPAAAPPAAPGWRTEAGAHQPRDSPQPQVEHTDLQSGVHVGAPQARIPPREQRAVGRIALPDPARAQPRQHARAAGPASRARLIARSAGDRPPQRTEDRPRGGKPGIEAVARRDDGGDGLQPREPRRQSVHHRPGKRRHRAGAAHHQHAGGLASASSAAMPGTKSRASARSR